MDKKRQRYCSGSAGGVTLLFIMLEHKARRAEADPGSVLKDVFQLYDPCNCLAIRVNVCSINKQRLAFDQHLFSEVCDLGRAPVIMRPQTDAHKDSYTLADHTQTHTHTHTLLTSRRTRQRTKAPLGMPVARTWEITKQSDLQNDIIAL